MNIDEELILSISCGFNEKYFENKDKKVIKK